MHDTTPNQGIAGRSWHARTFYVSDQMAQAAHRLSESEERRTGRRVGAGVIVDRALRRYVSELLAPEELARLLNGKEGDAPQEMESARTAEVRAPA